MRVLAGRNGTATHSFYRVDTHFFLQASTVTIFVIDFFYFNIVLSVEPSVAFPHANVNLIHHGCILGRRGTFSRPWLFSVCLSGMGSFVSVTHIYDKFRSFLCSPNGLKIPTRTMTTITTVSMQKTMKTTLKRLKRLSM
jgi:hypothetical protein